MMVGSDENVFGSRPIARTSSKRVTAQKPGPFGSSCQYTGACSRSHRYWSCGWPMLKLAGDNKSICMGEPRSINR
jgi:hypothetical protein